MEPKIEGINFRSVDEELLRYLHAVKVANYHQIHRDIYPGYHTRSVCNRLNVLEAKGLIVGMRQRFYASGKKVLSISKRGFEAVVAKETEKRLELKSEAIQHDLSLVDIRHRLMQANRISKYLTENQIQTWGSLEYGADIANLEHLNSDAIIAVQFPKAQVLVPLEYESHSKSETRYEPLVRNYYAKDEVAIVFYVCECEAIMNKIIKMENSLYKGDKPKFFFCLLKELLQDDAMPFKNCHGFALKMNESQPMNKL